MPRIVDQEALHSLITLDVAAFELYSETSVGVNAAVQTVTLILSSVHTTPLLCELHWLQVQFKALVITYEALHGMQTAYLRTVSP